MPGDFYRRVWDHVLFRAQAPQDPGYKAANFHHSTTVEIIWTIIPFVILIGMAYPATKTIIAMKDTSSPDITIKTTGYQWKWGYDYLRAKARASAS